MKITKILETALYVDDLDAAVAFYSQVFQLSKLAQDDRFCAFDVGGNSVLLLFKRGGSTHEIHFPGGVIPHHDGQGPVHFAFAVPTEDLPAWEQRLKSEGIAIEGRAHWPAGGESIFFRDLDQHLVELATPGLWKIY